MFQQGYILDGGFLYVTEEVNRDLEPGDDFALYANQGWREATCLAVIDETALVEYRMPQGTTSLRLLPAANPDSSTYRNLSYYRVPQKWIKAMWDAQSEWEGNPQQANKTKKAPKSIYELYMDLFRPIGRL